MSQNNKEIWDTVKRPTLRIIEMKNGEEPLIKGAKNIKKKKKTIEENFSNLKEEMPNKKHTEHYLV